MAHCCVVYCQNDWRYKDRYEKETGKKLSFHRFPKDEEEKKWWIVRIRRDEGANFKVTDSTYVCSAHFTADDFETSLAGIRCRLKKGARPSVMKWTEGKRKRPPPRCRTSLDLDSRHTATGSPASVTSAETGDMHQEAVHHEADHDYATPPQPQEEMNKAAGERIRELEEEVRRLRLERFGLERFSSDPAKIRFFTGFPSYTILKNFFDAIAPYAGNMIKWTQQQRLSCQKTSQLRASCHSKLLLIDQLFLFLHKVRLGTLDLELADKFGISQSSVSRNTISWANFLYCVLGSQNIWPSKILVRKHMPLAMKTLYPDVRVILDCTELKIQSPSSLVLNSEFFSSYKGTTTLKCLVGISPAGAVTFVSSLFAGSVSDKHITEVSGILDLLEEGDQVMADKGFLIDEMLKKKGCSLVIPHFLSKKTQFSGKESSENQIIANLRVHVERAIRRCREYHFFDGTVPLMLAGSVNQLWTVCCLLTNFQGPLIKKC